MKNWLPALSGVLARLTTLPPRSDATLFRITLDEPWLLGGGFTGHAMLGGVLMLIAGCIPRPRVLLPEAPAVQQAPDANDESVPAPEDAPGETFVALLPGEEPLVVDTLPAGEDAPPEADEASAGAASAVPEADEGEESPDEEA